MNPLVSVIIVNWNAKANLEECLNSLFKITYSPFEVIVVDNASSDGSVNLLEKKFSNVKIVKTDNNFGFAEGNNLGYKKSRGKYLLFLNNDCIVTNNFLTELVTYLEKNPTAGIVQPTIIFYRPKTHRYTLTHLHNTINSVGSFLLKSGFLYHQDYGKIFIRQKYSKPYEVFSVYGACFLAKRQVIEEVGLFDPDYFAYFEETDLCHRVWLAGYSVVVYPSVYILHKGAQTAQELPVSFIQFHSFKNRLCSYLKNLDSYYLFKMFVPHLLLCEITSLLFVFVGKPGYALAIQKAIFWNIKNYKKILSERRKVQKNIRRVNDISFIPKLTRTVGIKYYYFLSRAELEKYKNL